MPAPHIISITKTGQGATHGHTTAYKKATQTPGIYTHYIFIEDDAILCKNYHPQVVAHLKENPEELISFYLGTSRPPQYQQYIQNHIHETPYIKINNLIHGVNYAIPIKHQNIIYQHEEINQPPIDFRIGAIWYQATKKHILYTNPQLTNHEDNNTYEKHYDLQPRRQPRTAWNFIDR